MSDNDLNPFKKKSNKNRSYNNDKKGFNGKKQFRKNEKFVPDFKKKTATWRLIDNEIKELLPQYEEIDSTKITSFDDFPLSKRTKDGLRKANYTSPTEIQRESIGLALKGYDLLGAAKTGSGKTLAFLIPILETLFTSKWTKYDGLGVLVISPTRELAYQTFEVLKKIGRFHDFSAGLVIGGKDLKTESKIIDQTNIIICTPGRLLQHMDENYNFKCDNLKILVLDEADRILDMGFSETMNAIIANLPTSRQTLLFSATQTKSIKDLARLSLNNPTYVSVHEHASISTPENLVQNYTVCEIYEKLNFLWSFIRNHFNQKIIVFFQSCKQVKYVYELFTKMQTGMTTLALYGSMNQIRRMNVYDEYCRKQHAVLFATDIAARGLDFPSINWVIQMDCPPDANTYIHRVGRTARYEKDGQAILILTPHEEEPLMNELKQKKIPITKINANMRKIVSIESKAQALCAGDVELKESAKRALMAYLRSIYLMSNKEIFSIESIDIEKFSASLGLVVAPRIRFLQSQVNRAKQKDEQEEEDEIAAKVDKKMKKKLKLKNKMKEAAEKKDETLNFSDITRPDEDDDDEENDNTLFTVKRVYNAEQNSQPLLEEEMRGKIKIKTKASIVKQLRRKNIKVNQKVEFDDEGIRIQTGINVPKSINLTDVLADELNKKDDKDTISGINLEEARELLRNEDKYDKQLYRERIKRMHKEKKLKEKSLRRAKRAKTDDAEDDAPQVTLKTDFSGDSDSGEDDN